jgi:hypothetical protein
MCGDEGALTMQGCRGPLGSSLPDVREIGEAAKGVLQRLKVRHGDAALFVDVAFVRACIDAIIAPRGPH